MLETPSIRWYSFGVTPSREDVTVSSENPSGADNQQETVRSMFDLDPRWGAGFVDGEGCFSVSIHRNPGARSTGGWQLHPVFHVYQHEESKHRRDPDGILRDCTPGTSSQRRSSVKIQSDPHGDMGSQAEMT